METKPPLPSFTLETATQKVRMIEDAWFCVTVCLTYVFLCWLVQCGHTTENENLR